MTTVDQVEFDGRPCYKISLIRKTGGEDFDFYDVETGLKAGAIGTRESQMGPMNVTQFHVGLQEVRRPAGADDVEAVGDGRAADPHADRDRVRHGRPVGVRAAGPDQGAHQVRRSTWLLAVARGSAGPRRSALGAGAARRRDVRRGVDDDPRLPFRQDDERRELGRRARRAQAPRRGGQIRQRAARRRPRHARASRPVALRVDSVVGGCAARRVARVVRSQRRPGLRRAGSSAASCLSPASTARGVVVRAPGLARRRDCRAHRWPICCARFARSTAPRPDASPAPPEGGQRPPAERRGVAHRADASARARGIDGRCRVRERPGGAGQGSRWSAVPSRGSRSPWAACRRCSCGSRASGSRRPAGRPRGSSGSTCGWPPWTRSFSRRSTEFRASDGIIIDLRGNPGGLAGMMMGISGHFVGERKTLGVMKTRENELRFFGEPAARERRRRAGAALRRARSRFSSTR